MHVRYPKSKGGNKAVNRSKPTYFNLPKTVTWDPIKNFHIPYGTPIMRDMQFKEGIHVRLEQDWHGVFLERMPVFATEQGTGEQPDTSMRQSFWAVVRLVRNSQSKLQPVIPGLGETVTFDFHNGDISKGKVHETKKEQLCLGRVVNYGGKAWLENTGSDKREFSFSVLYI